MEVLYESIVAITRNTQNSASSHPKCVQQLMKLMENNELNIFLSAYYQYISHIINVEYKVKHPFAERSIDFVGAFCAAVESKQVPENDDESILESPFLNKLISYLLQTQENHSDIVRYRSCQMINKILDSLVGNELSIEICENIQEAMLQRANDGKVNIRMQAFQALYSLQEPMDMDCPVMDEYKHHMRNDSSAKVRKICVEKVALRKDVIPYVLARIRDTDVNVRIAAFNRSLKYPQHFKIIDKQIIIKDGFTDESKIISTFMSQQLVPTWLQIYDDDYLALLQGMRLDSDFKDLEDTTECVEFILNALFSTKPHRELLDVLQIDENRLLKMEDVNWDSVLYWRFFTDFLRRYDEFDEAVQNFIPDLVTFCQFIQEYMKVHMAREMTDVENLEFQFVLKQMLTMVAQFDFSDPAGRQSFNNLATFALQKDGLYKEVVDAIMDTLNMTIPIVKERVRYVCELVSEIMHDAPATPSQEEIPGKNVQNTYELAQMKVRLNCLREDQQVCIQEREFRRAEELETEIANLEKIVEETKAQAKQADAAQEPVQRITDLPVLIRYLQITTALLSSPKITELCAMLRTLKDDVIQPLLMHDNSEVQGLALKSYALCCILDRKSAEVGINLFCAPIDAYKAGAPTNTKVLLVAIGAVVDLILLFGADLIASPMLVNPSDSCCEEEQTVFKGGSSLTSVIQGLVDLMHDEHADIQECAGHGLCNLIFTGRVHSHSVISRLIIKWCSPASDEEEVSEILKQRIGLLLEKLPTVPDSAQQFEAAIIPTVKVILKAPRNSPLTDCNVDNIAKFMIELCRSYADGAYIHYNLALSLCSEIRNKPRARFNPTFSKMLLMLSLQKDEQQNIRELLNICDELRDVTTDRTVLNNVVKFNTYLTGLLNTEVSMIAEEEGDDEKDEI